MHQHLQTARTLIQYGANVRLTDGDSMTPFHYLLEPTQREQLEEWSRSVLVQRHQALGSITGAGAGRGVDPLVQAAHYQDTVGHSIPVPYSLQQHQEEGEEGGVDVGEVYAYVQYLRQASSLPPAPDTDLPLQLQQLTARHQAVLARYEALLDQHRELTLQFHTYQHHVQRAIRELEEQHVCVRSAL